MAFVLPVLIKLTDTPRPRMPREVQALILAPTRELATQITATIEPFARVLGLRLATVFGGVSADRQIAQLRADVDIVVACPGRLDDHAARGRVNLRSVQITVIDKAGHLADLGFLPVVRRLLDQTPSSGQRLLFSASLDGDVDVLVRRYLNRPVSHSVDPPAIDPTTQSHHVLNSRPEEQFAVLVDLTAAQGRSIVFTRTKRRARALTRRPVEAGVPVELHGNLAQTSGTGT